MADSAIKELVLRIENALRSEIGGHEAAKMAWSYAEFVSQVNQELVECADLIGDGKTLDALVKILSKPALFQRMEALQFASLKEWEECCTFFGWRKAEPLKENLAKFLTESLEDISDPKEFLISEFRASQNTSDPLESLRIVQILCSEFPDDKDFQIELNRLRKRCEEEFELQLNTIGDVDLNRSRVKSLIGKYLISGIVLENSGDLFKNAELAIRTHEANDYVREFIDESASYNIGDDWFAYERAFFVCDCLLDSKEAHELVDPEYKKLLGDMSSRLYSLRGSYEVNLQIRNTLALSAGKKRQKKLERLLAHANVMGYQVDDALKNDLSSVDNKDGDRGTSKLVPILGVCLPLLVISGWVYKAIVYEVPEDASSEDTTLAVDLPDSVPLNEDEDIDTSLVAQPESFELEPTADSRSEHVVVVPVEVVEAEPPVDPEYLDLIADFREIVAEEYTLESDSVLADIKERSKKYADIAQENYGDVAIEFAALSIQYELKKEARIKELMTLADFSALEAKRSAGFLESSTSEEKIRIQIDIVAKAIDDAYRAIHNATEVNPEYVIEGVEIAEGQLKEARESVELLTTLRGQLAESESLNNYYDLIGELAEFYFVSQDEKNAINLNLGRRLDLQASLKNLVMPNRNSEWNDFQENEDFLASSVMPSAEELLTLMEFIHDPLFLNVYVSTFRYYQGGYEPQGERLVYLSSPIVKIGDDSGETANLTFKEYGFGEDGVPNIKPRNLNYIKRSSGEVFGFFYEPSKLSPESDYFTKIVKETLDDSLSGASRSRLIELLVTVVKEQSLPPVLKALWVNAIFDVIDAEPFKWGAVFSPVLKEYSNLAKELGSEDLAKSAWLSVDEQRMPSVKWTEYFNDFSQEDPLSEVRAFAALYSALSRGALHSVGYVQMDGSIHFFDSEKYAETQWWGYDVGTDSLDRVKGQSQLTPYSVILAFEFEEYGIEELIENVESSFGIDFNDASYEDLLPPLLK